MAAEFTRSGGSRDRRLTVIGRRAERRVTARRLEMLGLGGGRLNMFFMFGCFLFTRWPRGDAAVATIEACAVYGGIIHHIFTIDVGDVRSTEIIDRAVIGKCPVVPVAAEKPDAVIAESVIDAAVETDMRSPIAGMERVDAVVPTPPGRRP
jgi:hypothetical protein